MDRLEHCTEIWGADTLIESEPAQEIVHRAFYNPFQRELWLSDPNWGLYRENGRIVEAAAYYRLPQKFRVGQSAEVAIPVDFDNAPPGAYVYVGPVIMHYGHFLTAFLPRLWLLVRGGLNPDAKLVCHSDMDPEDWFARSFVRSILGALGLGPERFIRPSRSTRFKAIHVPRPAMEEQTFVHRVFRDLGLRVGAKLHAPYGGSGPVYLSKTLLRGGTNRVGNEAAIDDAMAEAGVRVIRPETMSLAEQIGVISSASAVIGTIGSAFHTSLFCQQPCQIVGLAYENKINANYRLFDKLTGASATYVYAARGLVRKDLPGVTFGYWLDEPEPVVQELLQLV